MIYDIDVYKGNVLPVCGRPGMGQQALALQIANEYREVYGKAVLTFNTAQNDSFIRLICGSDKSTAPNEAKFVINSIDSLSESYVREEVYALQDIGLVVMLDYDFVCADISIKFLMKLAKELNIIIVVDALVHRRVDHRRNKIPKRRDIKVRSLRNMLTVIAVYREGYYKVNNTNNRATIIIYSKKSGEQIKTIYSHHTHSFITHNCV